MHPNKLGIIDDVKLPRVLAKCHRGTQTNENSNSSLPSSQSKSTSPRKGSSEDVAVTVFEYNQIVQDTEHPEIIAIIRDSFSEEILDHPNEKSKDTTSNRYRYCREVIKPFLSKDYSNNCESSDEDIIKDVLESVKKDYPDFKPCFPSCTASSDQCKKDSTKPNQPIKKPQPCAFLCDKVEAKSPTDIGSLIFPIALCPSSSGSSKNKSSTSMDKKNKVEDDYDEPYDPCKPKCQKTKSKCPEDTDLCKKPSAPKPPDPFCAKNSGPRCTQKLTTGCESAEDLKELEKERKKAAAAACAGSNAVTSKVDLLPPPSSPPGQKTVIESHCEALDTVMQAASTVLCKAFDVTRDTVTLIRTESAKHLGKIKASRSECEDMCDVPKPAPPKKKDPCEISNIVSKEKLLENLEKLETLDAEDVLHKMVEKVDSTISMISEHIDFDTIANILKSDDKNIYDRPTTPPHKVKLRPSHHSPNEQPSIQTSIHDNIQANVNSVHDNIQANINSAGNVFTAIKSKIFSIFSEVTKGSEKEKPEEQNPDIPMNEDDDEDEI